MLFTVDIEDFVFVQTEISLQPWSGGWNAVERPRGARTGPGQEGLLGGENLTLSQSTVFTLSLQSQHQAVSFFCLPLRANEK